MKIVGKLPQIGGIGAVFFQPVTWCFIGFHLVRWHSFYWFWMPCVSQLPVFTLKKISLYGIFYTYGALFLISEVTISSATILNGFFSCAECLIFYIYITPLVASLDPVNGQNLAPVLHVSLSPLYAHEVLRRTFSTSADFTRFCRSKAKYFLILQDLDCFLYEWGPRSPQQKSTAHSLKEIVVKEDVGFPFRWRCHQTH